MNTEEQMLEFIKEAWKILKNEGNAYNAQGYVISELCKRKLELEAEVKELKQKLHIANVKELQREIDKAKKEQLSEVFSEEYLMTQLVKTKINTVKEQIDSLLWGLEKKVSDIIYSHGNPSDKGGEPVRPEDTVDGNYIRSTFVWDGLRIEDRFKVKDDES